ncbi:hypothetical protein ACWFNE_09405 [Cellulomonas sp. NPDC055163]
MIMASALPDTRWMTDAACAQRLDLPWLADAADVSPSDELVMFDVCWHCRVSGPCYDFAQRVGACGGFWSGVNRDVDADFLPGLGDVA